jgi:hypothetical protein
MHATVALLDELALVPPYWKSVRLNAFAIVLALRHIFGGRAEVESFLLHQRDYAGSIRDELRALMLSRSKTVRILSAQVQVINENLMRWLARHPED